MSFGSEIAMGAGARDIGCFVIITAILLAIIAGLIIF